MATSFQVRYDVLKVEGLSDDEGSGKKKPNKGGQNKSNSQMKQQNKQQNNKQSNNKQQLNNNKQQQNNKQQNKQPNQQKKASNQGDKNIQEIEDDRWDEWVRADKTNSKETYEQDLHDAILASKLEFEKTKQKGVKSEVKSLKSGSKSSPDADNDKKKKNKNKPVAMSLQEFSESNSQTKKKKGPKPEPTKDALPLRLLPEGEANPNFFDDIDTDADKIVQIGKVYDEYQKQFVQESVRVQKLEERLKRRDMEITMLRTSLQKKEDEFQQVKKRNKQLCVILGQGEMKEKAEILMQAENLSLVNIELTEQVTEVTGDLEKERSKVHALEAEIERLKSSGRHHSGK